MKGLKDAPEDWEGYVSDYFGIHKIGMVYGMSEVMGMSPRCTHKHFHIMPHTIPILFDPICRCCREKGCRPDATPSSI